MAQLGKAFYCDNCGVEVTSGDFCTTCNPEYGSEEISYTFLTTYVGDEPQPVGTIQTENAPEWWAFWKR